MDGPPARRILGSKESISSITAKLAAPIEALAAAKGCTPSQVVIVWVLAQGEDVGDNTPETRHAYRLDENLGALSVTLSPVELDGLSRAIPAGAASGTRYPAGGMASVYI